MGAATSAVLMRSVALVLKIFAGFVGQVDTGFAVALTPFDFCLLGGSAKARAAAKAARKGIAAKKQHKVRTSVKFRRPKTLRLARDPKYKRQSVPSRHRFDKYAIVRVRSFSSSSSSSCMQPHLCSGVYGASYRHDTILFIPHKSSRSPLEKKYELPCSTRDSHRNV